MTVLRRGLKNTWLGVQKHGKIEEVTGSQDDNRERGGEG
jgi:hypothetical protein